MKSIIIKLSFLLLIMVFTGMINNSQAQPPRPPHSIPVGGIPIGGDAPIDGGISIMILLSAAYGTKKYFSKKEK